MARYMRGYGQYKLGDPIVGPAIAWHGPGTYLVYPRPAQFTRQARSRLPQVVPPVVVAPAFYGPKIYLNVMLPERSRSTVTRRRPTYQLSPPIIPPLAEPTRVTLAYSRRGQPESFLRPPTDTVGLEDQGQVQAWLTYSRRGAPKSRLLPPAVVTSAPIQLYFGPQVALAPSTRPITKSALRPPAVVGAGVVNPGLRIKLTFGRAQRGVAALFPPTDTIGPEDQGQVSTWLAYSRRGRPSYELRPPTDTVGLEDQGRISVHLARITPPPTVSALKPPAVIGAGIVNPGLRIKLVFGPRSVAKSHLFPPRAVLSSESFFGPGVTLAPSRRPKATYDLAGPVVLNVGGNFGWLAIQLAPSRRPQTKSVLRTPAVVTVVVQVYYGPAVHLARIRPRRVESFLRAPAILASNLPTQVTLAYSRRGRAAYRLRLPTDTIGIEDQGRVATHLAYSRRGRPIYELRPPTDTIGLEDQGQVYEWLAYSRRGIAKSALRPPAVVLQPPAYLQVLTPWLTYSRRGRPTYFYSTPAVIGAGVVNPGLRIKLVFGKRGVPKSVLRAPAVVGAGKVNPGIRIKLAFGRRPVAKSRLRPPLAPAGPPVSFGPEVHLTYSHRPKPLSGLGRPAIVDLLAPLGGILISLAPSFRGRAKSFIKPPTRVLTFVARPTQVFLAPQSRGVPKSLIKPPTVVRLAVEIYGPIVELAYSRRGRPQHLLFPPTVLINPVARAIEVHLVRIRPLRTIALLKPPTRVNGAIAWHGPGVYLTRYIPPAPTVARLGAPKVVREGDRFYGPLTTLVRIRPPRVIHLLRLTLVAFRRPHGDICGFDIAGSFVCSLEVPGSQVTGGTSTRFGISGSSRAGSKVSGSEQAGGSASGSDRKAT